METEDSDSSVTKALLLRIGFEDRDLHLFHEEDDLVRVVTDRGWCKQGTTKSWVSFV